MVEEATRLRVAAVGDIHVRESGEDLCRDLFVDIGQNADVMVLCGDLTNNGFPAEAQKLVNALVAVKVPVLTVLGNHDYEGGQQEELKRILYDAGVRVLEDEPYEYRGVGFAGVRGFAGGFGRHMLAPWGEQMIKSFVREAIDEALRLENALARLRTERKLAVLHYSPVRDTVVGEPEEIFAFLGSSRLEEPIDRFGVTAAVHGHAHRGAPQGKTMSGVPVYNVSLPLMRRMSPERPYLLLEL